MFEKLVDVSFLSGDVREATTGTVLAGAAGAPPAPGAGAGEASGAATAGAVDVAVAVVAVVVVVVEEFPRWPVPASHWFLSGSQSSPTGSVARSSCPLT